VAGADPAWPPAQNLADPVEHADRRIVGVDGILVVRISPVASSIATTSVNVPPVSMPIRSNRLSRVALDLDRVTPHGS